MALKMTFKGFEFEGNKDELIALMEDLEGGVPSADKSEPRVGDGHKKQSKTLRQALRRQAESSEGIQKGRVLKYHELCKLTGLRGQELSARLGAITRNSRNAVGHSEAWLIDHKWTIPYDRNERNYFVHPEAYGFLVKYI